MSDPRPHVLGLEPAEVRSRLEAMGALAAGRRLAEQAFRGVHQHLAPTFSDIPGLSHRKAPLLDAAFRPTPLELVDVQPSWDRSSRFVFRLEDGAVIESVLIPHHGLLTACVSSQAGCALACAFCATGRLGLRRNLRADEIVAQVHQMARHTGQRVSGVVFMGMGEPLQNERAVFRACRVLGAREGAQISPRRITISTAGLVPAIHRYAAAGHRMNLVFSLVSAVPEKRARLMPIQETFGFDAFLDAIRAYAATRRRHVTLEYVAIRGLTLGDDDAEAIRQHLRGFRFILNVIPLNPIGTDLESPSRREVRAWTEKLRPLGFPVKIRRSSARDQLGGCGQLGASFLERADVG